MKRAFGYWPFFSLHSPRRPVCRRQQVGHSTRALDLLDTRGRAPFGGSRRAPGLRDEGRCRSLKLPVAIIQQRQHRQEHRNIHSWPTSLRHGDIWCKHSAGPADRPTAGDQGRLPYVGRQEVYERGEANILFVLGQLKALQPNDDYDHLTLVGHSNGGTSRCSAPSNIRNWCRRSSPSTICAFPLAQRQDEILSFRSSDPNFKTDPTCCRTRSRPTPTVSTSSKQVSSTPT